MTSLALALALSLPTTPTTPDQPAPTSSTVVQALSEIKAQHPGWGNYYKVNKFDCSEMSAYVQDYLSRTVPLTYPVLKVGELRMDYTDPNSDQVFCHMWVETAQGDVIEAVSLEVVPILYHSWYHNTLTPVDLEEVPESELDWWR